MVSIDDDSDYDDSDSDGDSDPESEQKAVVPLELSPEGKKAMAQCEQINAAVDKYAKYTKLMGDNMKKGIALTTREMTGQSQAMSEYYRLLPLFEQSLTMVKNEDEYLTIHSNLKSLAPVKAGSDDDGDDGDDDY